MLSGLRLPAVILAAAVLIPLSAAQAVPVDNQGQPGTAPPQALAPVLLVDGGDTPEADAWYHAFMDEMFGVGNWDLYDLPGQGLPNPPELFQGIIGQYQGILWHANSSGMGHLQDASPYLAEYLQPDLPNSLTGRLLLVVPGLYVTNGYLGYPLQEEIGLFPETAPPGNLLIPEGKSAFTYQSYLGDLVAPTEVDASGLQPMEGTEPIYQMEYCICYGDPRRPRPPYDPIVGIRTPPAATAAYARAVTLGLAMHLYGSQGASNLFQVMKYHLGFIPVAESASGAGAARLAVSDAGYIGNFFQSPDRPSLAYPYPGFVEHLFQGGIWVGARNPGGELLVSTSSDHYNASGAGNDLREFVPDGNGITVTSNTPGSDHYHPDALAPWQLECSFHDGTTTPAGGHIPLGVTVHLTALAWDDYSIDDGVVLDYRLVNDSGAELRDVHFGLFTDTTVGNTQLTSPYYPHDYGVRFWNYFDDMNGGWRPGDLPGDPDIWMMWEHDDDGDEGLAMSWVGARLLGTDPEPLPPPGLPLVSFNLFQYGFGPEEDDLYTDPESGQVVPGRYQAMSNGDFDSGLTEDGDYSIPNNWLGLLSTGPFPSLAPGDTLRATYAMVCGRDGYKLMRNSYRFAQLYANDWFLSVSGTPSAGAPTTRLGPTAPNPFNAQTRISFTLDRAGWTTVEVFSPDGRRVTTLLHEYRDAGDHHVFWDGRDDDGRNQASGLYLHRLTTEQGERFIGHMTLLK